MAAGSQQANHGAGLDTIGSLHLLRALSLHTQAHSTAVSKMIQTAESTFEGLPP